ncbi:hypothetical protein NECAME_16911, partial [Necator americanus]
VSEILYLSGGIFAFFLLSGISIAVSLCLIHSRALGRKQVKYLSPYIFSKLFRMLALGTFSVVILISPRLITTYFYASIYGMFECVAGAVALEVISLYAWTVFKTHSLHHDNKISFVVYAVGTPDTARAILIDFSIVTVVVH